MIDLAAVEFLEAAGADRAPHSGRTLLDHLSETCLILQGWGLPDHVCAAGLFHSVYGTSIFRNAILGEEDRERVRGVIGDQAEHLAYVFCVFDRSSVYRALDDNLLYVERADKSERVAITQQEAVELVAIIWANELEQSRRRKEPMEPLVALQYKLMLERATRGLLPERAVVELRAFYGEVGVAPSKMRALLGDLAKEFVSAWPEEVLFARGPLGRLAGLVDYSFDELVEMPRSFAKAFRVVDNQPQSIAIEQGQEREFYDDGWTIYWHSLRSPRMDGWISAIDLELQLVVGATRVSAFASRSGPGLKPHFDMNDNFVCQARGKKRWRISTEQQVRYPTVGYTAGESPTAAQRAELGDKTPEVLPEPFETVDLEPGDVMFTPRGVWHDTETFTDESLHFNIQCGLATWKDVLEFLFTKTDVLRKREMARAPVLELRRQRGIGAELRSKLVELLSDLKDEELEISRPELYRFIAKARSAT